MTFIFDYFLPIAWIINPPDQSLFVINRFDLFPAVRSDLTFTWRYGKIRIRYAPVAQRIEHRPPKPGAQVRVLAGALLNKFPKPTTHVDSGE